MTDDLRKIYAPTPASDITFLDGSGLKDCPPCIENDEQAAQSSDALLPRVLEAVNSHTYDGILVCCFSDHPLVYELRRRCDVAVTGIFQAAIEEAIAHGGNFGICTTALAWQSILAKSVRDNGYEKGFIGVLATGIGVLELETLPRSQVLDTIISNAMQLVNGGATSIILGCAGMAKVEDSAQARLPQGIKVIDGMKAGISNLQKGKSST